MTDIFPLIAIAVIAAAAAIFLKDSRAPALALLLVLAAGALIFIRLFPALGELIGGFVSIGELAGVNNHYLTLILKIIGVAYIAEFGAQLCRDAAQGAAALKIEFAAKVAIMGLALPIIAAIIELMLGLL
ncbi:MAG: stage III sporulation protein AD [Bacillota bacterium]|nr:stage III sporulation protein AD [Bacillota bacterium]